MPEIYRSGGFEIPVLCSRRIANPAEREREVRGREV